MNQTPLRAHRVRPVGAVAAGTLALVGLAGCASMSAGEFQLLRLLYAFLAAGAAAGVPKK